MITSLNVDAAPVNTNVPVIGYNTYYFTVELPSTELASGWISVQATTASPTFYWLNTMSGVGNAYQNAVLLPLNWLCAFQELVPILVGLPWVSMKEL